jgi:hypothetical protein
VTGALPSREPPDPGDLDELALIAAGFPGFRLWRETNFHRTCYVASSRDLNSHPHAIVTADLTELSAALQAGQHTSDDSYQ